MMNLAKVFRTSLRSCYSAPGPGCCWGCPGPGCCGPFKPGWACCSRWRPALFEAAKPQHLLSITICMRISQDQWSSINSTWLR